MSNSLGYACVNMQLAHPKKYLESNASRIFSARTMIKKTFMDKGVSYASEIALKNCIDLFEIIKWNKANKFNFFRVSSDMFPWSSEYELIDLPDYLEIKSCLKKIGNFASENNMRLTSHPGPFNVLTSPKESVVLNCVKDLSIQGEVFNLMNLPQTPYSKINIHIGGAYGDKQSAMERFCQNFSLLPDYVKKRLTVENDDRDTLYSVKDLYHGVYKKIGIPIVFDFHHHKFCDGGMSEKDAFNMAVSTWGNIKPVVHYSESKSYHESNSLIKPQAHSDYINNLPDTYGYNVDVMIEAKAKELSLKSFMNF